MVKRPSALIEKRFLAGTLLVLTLLAFLTLREYLYYIIGGILLVFAFFPIHRRVQRGVPQRGVAAFVSFLVVLVVVLGPLVLLGYFLLSDADTFARTYDPERLNETIQSFLSPRVPEGADVNETVEKPSEFATWVGTKLQGFAEKIVQELGERLPRIAVGLTIMGFTVFYGFADGPAFYRRVRLAIPLPDHVEDALFQEIRRVTSVVFVGNILVSVAGGLFGALTFVVFGVPNAMFWGFIMIILGILPFVGAPMVWIPAGLWLYVHGEPEKAIGLVLANGLIIVGYLDHILRPKLMGRAAKVHPILILVGVLGGVETFGPLGFVIGPLVLALFVAIVRSYTEWHPYWKERREAGLEPFHDEPTPEAHEAAKRRGKKT